MINLIMFVLNDLGFHMARFSTILILSLVAQLIHVLKEIVYFRQRTKIEFRLYMSNRYVMFLKSANLYYFVLKLNC